MKIRIGFVSNSSSSSFICAYKESDSLFCKMIDLIEQHSIHDCETTSLETLKENLERDIEYAEKKEWDSSREEQLLQKLEEYKDYTIKRLELDNHNSLFNTILEEAIDCGEVIIVKKEGL